MQSRGNPLRALRRKTENAIIDFYFFPPLRKTAFRLYFFVIDSARHLLQFGYRSKAEFDAKNRYFEMVVEDIVLDQSRGKPKISIIY